MNEKPILFSTEMIGQILNDNKTQTRRIIKPQPAFCVLSKAGLLASDEPISVEDGIISDANVTVKRIPYQIGSILWVRETFFSNPCEPICLGREDEDECPFNHVGDKCYGYKAQYTAEENGLKIKWRPAIHMPKEAARIFLRVTDVRVERLQDITESDAYEEGCQGESDCIGISNCGTPPDECEHYRTGCKKEYRELWDKLNAKRGYGWETNPYVFVYSFKITSEEK